MSKKKIIAFINGENEVGLLGRELIALRDGAFHISRTPELSVGQSQLASVRLPVYRDAQGVYAGIIRGHDTVFVPL